MQLRSKIEQCVNDWHAGAITRAEVIDCLHSLRTLEDQMELLSRLPEFLEDAKESVLNLPDTSDEWLIGAHIPRIDLDSPARLKELKQSQDEYLGRLRRLHAYLLG